MNRRGQLRVVLQSELQLVHHAAVARVVEWGDVYLRAVHVVGRLVGEVRPLAVAQREVEVLGRGAGGGDEEVGLGREGLAGRRGERRDKEQQQDDDDRHEPNERSDMTHDEDGREGALDEVSTQQCLGSVK